MKRNDEEGDLGQRDEGWCHRKSSFLRQLRPDPEHDDGTDGGRSDAAEPSWLPMDAEEVEQPLADDTADESEEEVDPAALPSPPVILLAMKPARIPTTIATIKFPIMLLF
jgi:hypothetical protein